MSEDEERCLEWVTWSEAERDITYGRSVDESVEAYEPNVASSFTPQTYHAKYHL